MSDVGPEGRSFKPITREDLERLLDISRKDWKQFFQKYPEWDAVYGRERICIALCQGAALHYINGTTGINDFDVYAFYRKRPEKKWYPRRCAPYDFGDSKFGQSENKPRFVGRRIDSIARSITVREGESVVEALRRYLREGKSDTAKHLAKKAVVLLEPDLGRVIWPEERL